MHTRVRENIGRYTSNEMQTRPLASPPHQRSTAQLASQLQGHPTRRSKDRCCCCCMPMTPLAMSAGAMRLHIQPFPTDETMHCRSTACQKVTLQQGVSRVFLSTRPPFSAAQKMKQVEALQANNSAHARTHALVSRHERKRTLLASKTAVRS
jgi:hypothetical protein